MKEISHSSKEFVSDDGRIGIVVELEDNTISRITFARKNKELAEMTWAEFQVFAELSSVARKRFMPPVAEG